MGSTAKILRCCLVNTLFARPPFDNEEAVRTDFFCFFTTDDGDFATVADVDGITSLDIDWGDEFEAGDKFFFFGVPAIPCFEVLENTIFTGDFSWAGIEFAVFALSGDTFGFDSCFGFFDCGIHFRWLFRTFEQELFTMIVVAANTDQLPSIFAFFL